MKQEEYFSRYGKELSAFLATEAGFYLFPTLAAMRPNLVPHSEPHLIVEGAGAARGYEQCMKNIRSLVVPKASAVVLPQPTYGIVKPQPPSDEKPKPTDQPK